MVDQTLDEVRHVQEINRGKRFEELKRNYMGYEISKKYKNIIEKKLNLTK